MSFRVRSAIVTASPDSVCCVSGEIHHSITQCPLWEWSLRVMRSVPARLSTELLFVLYLSSVQHLIVDEMHTCFTCVCTRPTGITQGVAWQLMLTRSSWQLMPGL